MNGPILVHATNQNPASICTLEKVLGHKVVCWISCHNREPSGLLKVPYVGLQRNRNSNMPHCSSYTCSKTVLVSCLVVTLWVDQNWNSSPLIRWDSHSHRNSADARRPDWIDPTMKTTSTTRQTSPYVSYIHIHTLRYKIRSLAFL